MPDAPRTECPWGLFADPRDAVGTPEPLNEAHGLLFLSPAELFGIANRRVTLGQHLRSVGRAILRPGFPRHLPLDPHLQLLVLTALLNRHPDLAG